jgi:hypothetical protein
MKSLKAVLIPFAILAGLPSVRATTIFADNFNTENGGAGATPYSGFAQWEVSDGTVDLIGLGYWDFLPGNGLYLDMDGSTFDAGRITTTLALVFTPTTNYTLSFDLAGNQRHQVNDSIRVSIDGGVLSQEITLSGNVPFTQYSYTFSVPSLTSAKLSFEGLARNNQVLGNNEGLLLDNVMITETSINVPDVVSPAFSLGAVLLSWAVWRRYAA